jgi:imidazolonepropionase-like amidohydrolase
VVDLHGQYVLLGFIDAHVHLSGSGETDSQFEVPMGRMVLCGVFLVPTLKVGWDIILVKESNIPNWIMQKNIDSQGDAERSLKMAYEAGVPIAMGSDVGTPLNYHGENALEVYWMHKAELSVTDALVAATGNAAKALGWDEWMGTLEPGKVADLIVTDYGDTLLFP